MNKAPDKETPKMSDFEMEDVVSILLGVPPEGEEIEVCEEGEVDQENEN